MLKTKSTIMSTYSASALGIYERYQNTARTIATIAGILFLVLFFWNLLTYQDPPPGQSGILVSFGQPNIGQGDEVSAPPPAAAEEEVVEETEEEVSEPEVSEPEVSEPEVAPEPTPSKPEPSSQKDVIEDKRSKELALQKKKDEERKKVEDAKRKAEADAKKKAEADAKRKADAEAKRKAEAEAARKAEEARKKAEADKLKGEIGGLFGQTGDGKGNTGSSGNQGDPNGDPNSDILTGISTGGGKVGGGLGNRGGNGPRITDKSQATGRVVVKVCVDARGNVLSAKFTQSGSTTSNSQLRSLAESNAQKWKFKPGELDKQCGTITYEFKVK
jgi:TonB family protein